MPEIEATRACWSRSMLTMAFKNRFKHDLYTSSTKAYSKTRAIDLIDSTESAKDTRYM